MFDVLPSYPDMTDVIGRCIDRGDYSEYLFETLKHVSKCVNVVACIGRSSPSLRPLDRTQYAAYSGHLNRCSRLCLAYVALSSDGGFAETTAILDRCICETFLRLRWLIQQDQKGRVKRYICDSLKKDLEFRDMLLQDADRRGHQMKITARLKGQVESMVAAAEYSEEDIRRTKKLPDFRSMLTSLDLPDIHYQIVQRQRSHSVHGSWTDLLWYYLRLSEGGEFVPRDHGIRTQPVQFLFVLNFMITTTVEYLKYIIADPSEHGSVDAYFSPIMDKLNKVRELMLGGDREPLDEDPVRGQT